MATPMTTQDVALRTNRSTATIQRWCRDGIIPHKRLKGTSLLFDMEEVETWLKAKTTGLTAIIEEGSK
jgi:excisionase family DNA binding protein